MANDYLRASATRAFVNGKTITDPDRLDLRNRIWSPARTGNIKVIGDSLSAGYQPISGVGKDWCSQLMGLTNWVGRAAVSNEAVASLRAADIVPKISTYQEGWRCDSDKDLAFVFLGQNDIANQTATQLKANLTTIWAAARAAGRKVVAFIPPRVGNTAGTPLTVREDVWPWIGLQSDKWDWCIDLGDLTEADTVGDSIHLTPTANLTVANRINSAVGSGLGWFPGSIRTPGQRFQGPVVIDRQNPYVPGISVRTDDTGWDLETDVYRPTAKGIEVDGVPHFPFPFPTGRGISIGQSAMTQAALASAISISNTTSFLITAWVKLGARHAQNAVNHAVILGSSAANHMFYLSGSGTTGSTLAIRPVIRINGVDYSMPVSMPADLAKPGTYVKSVRIGEPVFVAVYRNSGQLGLCINGVWAWAGGNTVALAFDRLGWRDVSASTSWMQGEMYGVNVTTWSTINTVTYRDAEYLLRGGDPMMIPGTKELVYEFMPGDRRKDRSGNKRHLNLASATSWAYLSQLGRPDEGVSADRGDAGVTLNVNTNHRVQRWLTPLTADRAVVLDTTGAEEGAIFDIIRAASATGAFNLNVGTGPLKALAAGQWARFCFDGTNWFLLASGSV